MDPRGGPTVTELTKASEALLGVCVYDRECHVPMEGDEEVENPTPEQWAAVHHSPHCRATRGARRKTLIAIEAAVRSDTLADVAARLPEALDRLDAEDGTTTGAGAWNAQWDDSKNFAAAIVAALAHLTGGPR
jgi:hypothetical protein